MKSSALVLITIALAVLAGLGWHVLHRTEQQASWLRVEAPAQVQRQQNVVFRVTVLDSGSHYLNVDLHGWTRREHRLDAVSHAAPQRVAPNQSATFSLPMPERSDLYTIRAVVYLSPTGLWADHTRVAMTAPIEIATSSTASASQELVTLRAEDTAPDPGTPRQEILTLRFALGGLWFVVAALTTRFWLRLRCASATPEVRKLSATLGFCSALSFITAGVEFTGAEAWLDDGARHFAMSHDLYDQRLSSQKIAVFFSLAILATVIALLPRLRCRRLVGALFLNATVVAIAIFSLHDTDTLLYTIVGHVPVEQLLKLSAVAIAFWGVRGAAITPQPGTNVAGVV